MQDTPVNQVDFGRLMFLSTLIAISSNWQFAFSNTYLNTPVEQFKVYINESIIRSGGTMSESTYTWMWDVIQNIWFVGFFLGIWLSPLLNDRQGRKPGLLTANVFNLISAILQFVGVLIYQPAILIVGRAIASISTAVSFQAVVLYLQECSPTYLRGTVSYMSEIVFAGLCIVGMMLGTDQLLGNNLPALLAVNIPPCIFAVVVVVFIPETPKFLLVSRNDRDAAARSIRFFQGRDAEVSHALKEMEIEACDEQDQASSLRDIPTLLKEPHLRSGLLLSAAALQNCVPLWTFIYNSTRFLLDMNVDSDFSKWASTLMCTVYFVGTFIGGFLIDRVGRRKMLLPCTAINIVSIVLFGACSLLHPVMDWIKYVAIAILQLYAVSYGIGVGAISWFLAAELSPMKYRSLVQSACYSINTISVVISSFAMLPFYDLIGAYSFLILYTIPSAFCLFYLYRWLPETKGREIHQIVDDLKAR